MILDAVLSLLGSHTAATRRVLFRSVKTTAFIDSGGENNREFKGFLTDKRESGSFCGEVSVQSSYDWLNKCSL